MNRVTEAKWVRDYIIRLRFSDGLEGEVDLRDELDGPVFEPLRMSMCSERLSCTQISTPSYGATAPISRRSFCTAA